MLFGGLLLLAAPGAIATADAPASSPSARTIWTTAARRKMVSDALKITPPALARIIERNAHALAEGLARGEGHEGQPHHRQEGDTPGVGAAAALVAVARDAVEAMETHRPMDDLAYLLGLAAHFAADLSDPTLTAPGGGGAAFTGDYAAYAESNLGRFPVVFYGYPVIATGEDGVAARPLVESLEPEGHAAATKARGYFTHLERAYGQSRGTSHAFDVRSIPFGVASLCYSRGVTNIARAWLHVWRSARGDLTGTPHLRWERPGPQVSKGAAATAPASPDEPKNAPED